MKICLIIGYPNKHSKSPLLHNIGYKALGIEDQFIYVDVEVKPNNLKMAVDGLRALDIRGCSVTMPYKQEVMKYLDKLDNHAKVVGAVNTIVNENGKLIGYNTDWIGAINALKQKTNLKGKKVAMIGAGGAARAIVYGLTKEGAKVKIFNRTIEKASQLSKEFKNEFAKFESIKDISKMDIIINATSVGMFDDKNSPIDKELIRSSQIVFDAVYFPHETKLIKDAREKRATVIFGYEMLLYQGVEQFKLFTGRKAPIEIMRKTLEESL